MLFITNLLEIIIAFFLAVCLTRQLFKRKKKRVYAVCFFVLCALFAAVTYSIVDKFHPLTDQVTVTALNQPGSESLGKEVFLRGFTVDGERFPVDKIAEGKWFWIGEHYVWRPEEHAYQPEGTTCSVSLCVPVGMERQLDFCISEQSYSNLYGGWVNVQSQDGVSVTIDTSSATEAKIGPSSASKLLLNMFLRLTVFFITFSAMVATAFFTILNLSRIKQWNSRHNGIGVIALIAIAQLAVSLSYASKNAFWMDELCEISWNVTSTSIVERMFCGYAPLYLYALFGYFWYTIMPYGEVWLLIPAMVVTALAVFFVGLCARELRGCRAGILAAMASALSSYVLVQFSYEYRSYPFFFFFAALLLYVYLKRWTHLGQESWREILLVSLCMSLFAGMHYHAVVTCFMLGILDLVLFLQKKVSLRCVIPYLCAAVCFLPNFIHILNAGELFSETFINEWQPVPNLSTIRDLINTWAGGMTFLTILFWLGFSVCVWQLVLKAKEGSGDRLGVITQKEFLPLYLLVCVISFFLVYGNFINQKSTLWHPRYFADLLPIFFVLVSCGIDWMLECAERLLPKEKQVVSVLSLFLILTMCPGMISALQAGGNRTQPIYKKATNWLYDTSGRTYPPDSLVLVMDYDLIATPMRDYYGTMQGRRDPLNIRGVYSVTREDVLQYNTVYLVSVGNDSILSQYSSLLEDNNYEVCGYSEECGIVVYERTYE